MASGVTCGVGVGLGVAAWLGVATGLAVGLGVGLGVGRGVGAGAHPLTPLPLTLPTGSAVWKRSGGSVPLGGNRLAARARMSGMSGTWMEPRSS